MIPKSFRYKEDRYYSEEKRTLYRIYEYYPIFDKEDEDKIIWVDCTEEQLEIIVRALNESE